jgi:hypothetical protein
MLVRCLYASHAVEPLGDKTLDQILEKSRKNNPARGITGLLCHSNGIFVQVLEGGREPVSRLIGTIFTDNRHRDMQILLLEEIAERQFGNWTMGKINAGSINAAALLKYSEKADLDPFNSPARASLALLSELASSGSIASRV